MTATKGDPCLLYRRNKNEVEGITILHVDDSLGLGTESFLREERKASEEFEFKPRKILKPGMKAMFNGTAIQFDKDTAYLSQKEKLEELDSVTTEE